MNLGLVLMVKDEAEVIDRCLASARPYISSWTVVDTGSTDDTPERVEAALEGIPGKLWRLPFVNFGHSRSELLVAARGTADWLLCLDADNTVAIDDDFEPDPAVEAYMVDFGWEGFENRLPLLLRGDLPWKSVGPVHEATVLPGRMYVSQPTDKVRIRHHGQRDNGPAKWKWHASLLEAEIARNPDDARSTFYLAETFKRLGDTANALRLYRQRSGMTGFVEETWFARYQAALLEPDWPTRQAALIEAWEARPNRLEPLHDLVSELNRRDMHHAAYVLTDAGYVDPASDQGGISERSFERASLTDERGPIISPAPTVGGIVPPSDNLFVQRSVWDWGLAFQRSIAAWYTSHRDESRTLSLSLLQNPRLPASVREAVTRNLALTPEVKAA